MLTKKSGPVWIGLHTRAAAGSCSCIKGSAAADVVSSMSAQRRCLWPTMLMIMAAFGLYLALMGTESTVVALTANGTAA